MNKKKIIIFLNIIGIILLAMMAIPYITHDTTIHHPNAMLATENWDQCGFILTIGLFPLLIVNFLAYHISKTQRRILYFLPSLLCFLLVGHYLMISISMKSPVTKEENLATITCKIENKEYKYSILKENGELAIKTDENKIPSPIDDTSPTTIIESITEYYTKKGGTCQYRLLEEEIKYNLSKIKEVSDLSSSNPYHYINNKYYQNIVDIGKDAVFLLREMYNAGELSGLDAYISALAIQDITNCNLLKEYKIEWDTAKQFYELWENYNCGFNK